MNVTLLDQVTPLGLTLDQYIIPISLIRYFYVSMANVTICNPLAITSMLTSKLAVEYAHAGGGSSGNGSNGSGGGGVGVEALVYSVDIDELAEVAVAHDVSTLPRLLFFKVTHLPLSTGYIHTPRPPGATIDCNPSHHPTLLNKLFFFKV